MCFWEQAGVWGSTLWFFKEGWVGSSGKGALLSCYLCLKSCLFFSETFPLVFIPAQWAAVLWAGWCCIHRNHRKGQLTPAWPCSVPRSSEEPRSITVQCLPALGEELLHVCHRAGCLWQHCMFFSCRNGLILLLDWQHFFVLGYWLPLWKNLWFLRL